MLGEGPKKQGREEGGREEEGRRKGGMRKDPAIASRRRSNTAAKRRAEREGRKGGMR